MMFKLPLAFLSGIRIKNINSDGCTTTVKLGFLNKNPFRSVYFAVIEMAAELSGGLLLFDAIRDSNINASMLLLSNKNEFFKKAVGRIYFTCEQKKEIFQFIQNMQVGESVLYETKAKGTDESGAVISESVFQWSIKRK